MSDVAIKIENISKIYHLYDDPVDRLKESLHPLRKKYHHDFYALNDVSFDVKKGETVGIIGRNGSGKSTLLKILAGVLTPSSGRVRVNGRVLALLELGTGFNPELTGIENIYFNGMLMGATKEKMDRKLEAILKFADIDEFVYQPVKTYSSGMYVRLAFAIIANMDADILIVDEALAVGDAFFVQKCMRFLRKFMKNGTVFFVSHDVGAVLNLCQTAVLLHKGVVVTIGKPKEVTEYYLEKLHEDQQDGNGVKRCEATTGGESASKIMRDMRLDFINKTRFRNDIELFSFSPEVQSFGMGGVEISDVKLMDRSGNPLAWLVGGEPVSLVIKCKTLQSISSPIVGFMVKDRLGQVVFADNTYLTYAHCSLHISSGARFETCFDFSMPIMPIGDYTISVSVAEGTQVEHIQHQWIHEALTFRVHSSSVCHGLIGVPMENIKLIKL